MAIWGLMMGTGPEIEAVECHGRAKGEFLAGMWTRRQGKRSRIDGDETEDVSQVVMAEGTRRVYQELSGKVL